MNCPKCGAKFTKEAVFCNSCGCRLFGGSVLIISSNVVGNIQEKSLKLFNRTTYSILSKVLFFSALVAIVGGVLGAFSIQAGAYVFAVPLALMYLIVIYRAFMTFVDINALSDEALANELRHMLTYFAYSLFLLTLATIVASVADTMSAMEYMKIRMAFYGLSVASGGLTGFSILISFLIFLSASVRIKGS